MDSHGHWPDAFSLNTDAKTFLTWLEVHIEALPKLTPLWQRAVWNLDLRSPGIYVATFGDYTGRSVDQNGLVLPNVRAVDLDPLDDSIAGEWHGLEFRVICLAQGRVEVSAGYRGDPEAEGYLNHILNDVQDNYPESREKIGVYVGEAAEQDLAEAARRNGEDAEEDVLSCIPEGRNRECVRYWRAGLTAPEIANKFPSITSKTVHNTLCSLRGAHGETVVPYHRGKSKAK